jgi:hypothetical protein
VGKGTVAGDRLFELLEGSEAPDALLPVQLVVRASTAPPPSSPTPVRTDVRGSRSLS